MIPKIIHYCWFGDKKLSALNQKCIESWGKFLPGYQIMLWNESNIPDHPYVKFALANKKYAFAADFTRFYALVKYGGVYFDTDVEVVKSFDSLLEKSMICAYEDINNKNINCAIIGATPNHSIALAMLEKYSNNREFINIPLLMNQVVKMEEDETCYQIFPYYYFYPYNPFDESQPIKQLMYSDIKNDTYAIDHWEFSWKPTLGEKIYNRLSKIFK